MHWLFLSLALGLLGVALTIKTSSHADIVLLAVCLLGAFGLLVAWIMALYAARVGTNQRDETQMIDPVELRRLRELAAARKAGTTVDNPSEGQ